YWFGGSYQNGVFHESAGMLAAERDHENMLIMAPDYPGGRAGLTGFKRGYGRDVSEEIYTSFGQSDYAAERAPSRAAKPDAGEIFFPAAMGINFIKQFEPSGLFDDIDLIGPGFSGDEDVIMAVGEPMLGMFNTS